MKKYITQVGAVALLLSVAILPARAESSHPELQGRFFEDTSGQVYVVKDGARIPIELAQVDDETFAALPQGQSVTRLDELFKVASTPAPVATKPGGPLLYQTDFSDGAKGWTGDKSWKAVGGMLVSSGGSYTVIYAPFRAPTPDYAVEAEIQVLPSSEGGYVGVIARMEDQSRKYGGASERGRAVIDRIGGNSASIDDLGGNGFVGGSDWHTYRLEAKANQQTLYIDGTQLVSVMDNAYTKGQQVGLVSSAAANVRAFRVYGL